MSFAIGSILEYLVLTLTALIEFTGALMQKQISYYGLVFTCMRGLQLTKFSSSPGSIKSLFIDRKNKAERKCYVNAVAMILAPEDDENTEEVFDSSVSVLTNSSTENSMSSNDGVVSNALGQTEPGRLFVFFNTSLCCLPGKSQYHHIPSNTLNVFISHGSTQDPALRTLPIYD
jgi:hypothetical protein